MNTKVKPADLDQEQGAPKRLYIPAFEHDAPLSKEAAEQLVDMARDPNVTAHAGKQLPSISEKDILKKSQ